jgi:hypothetical protein
MNFNFSTQNLEFMVEYIALAVMFLIALGYLSRKMIRNFSVKTTTCGKCGGEACENSQSHQTVSSQII